MAKSAAERQSRYRARELAKKTEQGHTKVQLNLIVSAAHRALLTATAKRHGVTQAEMLTKIIETSPIVQVIEQAKDDFLLGRCSG